jgi:hypothetical protein
MLNGIEGKRTLIGSPVTQYTESVKGLDLILVKYKLLNQ